MSPATLLLGQVRVPQKARTSGAVWRAPRHAFAVRPLVTLGMLHEGEWPDRMGALPYNQKRIIIRAANNLPL